MRPSSGDLPPSGANHEALTGVEPTMAAVTKGTAWMAVGQLVSQLAWSGSLVVLGALLPPSAFGTVAVGMALVGVATLLMQAGTYGSIIATRRLGSRVIRESIALNVSLGVGISLVIVLLAGAILDEFAAGGDVAVLRALTPTIVMASLGAVPVAVLLRHMRFRRYTGIAIAAYTIASVTAMAAAFAGAGAWSLVVRQVLLQTLIATLAWLSVWHDRPQSERKEATSESERSGRGWFMALAAADFVAFNADYLIVGWRTNAATLGLYSLAFTLAFAPLKQFAWQVGAVFFSASAATSDPTRLRQLVFRVLRITSLLLLPLVAPAVTLAPTVIPGVLGEEWSGMVRPFQILIVAGVGHAVLNGLGEFLSGTGNVAFRARTSVAWAIGMVTALAVLTAVDGIRGAAVAHLVLFVPLVIAYFGRGLRRVGVDPAAALGALRGILVAVSVQAVATAGVFVALDRTGAPNALAAGAASVAGLVLAAATAAIVDASLWSEARAALAAGVRRRRAG